LNFFYVKANSYNYCHKNTFCTLKKSLTAHLTCGISAYEFREYLIKFLRTEQNQPT
jgi:hypothetical protein